MGAVRRHLPAQGALADALGIAIEMDANALRGRTGRLAALLGPAEPDALFLPRLPHAREPAAAQPSGGRTARLAQLARGFRHARLAPARVDHLAILTELVARGRVEDAARPNGV